MMRGGIIGFGTSAAGHLAAYKRIADVHIVAICDPSKARRDLAASQIPAVTRYDDFTRMLMEQNLDFVDICSPPNTHFTYICEALSYGCHVLCEKPLLLNTAQYEVVLSTARSVKRIVMPCHNYKYSSPAAILARSIASAECGTLLWGSFRTIRTRPAQGVAEWRPAWRCEPSISGGGILIDHGTHSVYLASYLTSRVPQTVSCVLSGFGSGAGQFEQAATMLIDYSDLRWHIELSWLGRARQTCYTIAGTRGTVAVDENAVTRKLNGRRQSVEPYEAGFRDSSHSAWFSGLFEDFRTQVTEGGDQFALLLEPLLALLTINAAIASHEAGGAFVAVEPTNNYLRC